MWNKWRIDFIKYDKWLKFNLYVLYVDWCGLVSKGYNYILKCKFFNVEYKIGLFVKVVL